MSQTVNSVVFASIILVLPAYNEAVALPPLLSAVATIRATIPNLCVIVVDDGSRDGTAQVARDYARPWVQLVQHPKNLGLAAAMRTGLTAALAAIPVDGLIATMDADNSHQPHELVHMLAKTNAGYDVIIASRYQPGSKIAGVSLIRQILSLGVSVLFRTFTPITNVRDFSCGYRLYRASVLHRATNYFGGQLITEHGFACNTEILLKLSLFPDMRFGETPMDLRYDRKPGASKMNLNKNIHDMWRLMWQYRLLRHNFKG